MHKLTLKLILAVIIATFTLTVFAQNFFSSSSSSKKNEAPTLTYPPANPVMSPEQFKNKVNMLSQQNTNALNQQLSQELSRTQQPQSQPPIPPSTQPSANDFSSINNQPSQTPSAPGEGQTMQPGQTFGNSTGLPNQRSAPARQANPSQNNTYTGFGTGTNTGGGSNTGGNSGGWNIKY